MQATNTIVRDSVSFTGKDYDVCEINNVKFAFVNTIMISNQSIDLNLSDYHVILLAPLTAEKNISITATSVLNLTTLTAKKGETIINASKKVITLGGVLNSFGDNNRHNVIAGKEGIFTPAIAKERLDIIVDEFEEAISQRDGPAVLDALLSTFHAIKNPDETDESIIDVAEAMEFFNIPL